MRNTFIKTVTELACVDPDIEVLTGDLGFGVWNDYREKFPSRFTNVGIAEQNMVSMAAGMAITGKIVFVYSIGNFPTMRCLEQIRNDCAYHGADVKIVSVGAGLSYGPLGMSHHATEDIAIIRAIPGMTVYSPSDTVETETIVRQMASQKGPCYLRIGRGGTRIHRAPLSSPVQNIYPVSEGKDACVTVFVTGDIITEVLEAAERLKEANISADIFSVPCLKPWDPAIAGKAIQKAKLVVTVEEHSVIGGLGSLIAETMSGLSSHPRLLRIGIPDVFPDVVGDQQYIRKSCGLDSKQIAKAVITALEGKI